MQVCVEHIHQASTWPPEVSGVYRALGSPLPSWCSKGPYQFVSSAVLPLLPELLEVSLYGDDSRNSPQPLLSDVFNLTLSTVADIRSIRAYYHSTPSTIPFVLGLIRGLVHACTKEAVILTETPFVRPRTSPPESGLDGIATILACHVVEGGAQDSSSSATTIESSLEWSTSADSESTTSSAGIASIDVPLEGHLLPGCGKRHLCAVLPFLSVADSKNITDLMSSLASQRYVWGIKEPAMGFMLSDNGVEARLVLSWVNPSTHVIHIIFTPDNNGVFNFTKPVSALAFSQLVLNLAPQFDFSGRSCEHNLLFWRADTPGSPSKEENEASWRESVAIWVRDVGKSGAGSIVVDEKTQKSGQSTDDHSPILTRPEDACSSRYPTEPSFKPIDSDDTELPWSWALDRGVQPLAAGISLQVWDSMTEDARAEVCEINDKVKIYDTISGFYWCTSWNADSRPEVDAALVDVRDSMFEQAEQERQPGGDVPAEDSLDHRFTEGRICAVLLSSRTLRYRTSFTVDLAARHEWNRLLYTFCVRTGEMFADTEFLVDGIDKYSETALALAANSMVKSRLIGPQAFHEAANVLGKASDFNHKLTHMQNNKGSREHYRRLIQDRSRHEPRAVKCDVLLFVTVPAPPEVGDAEFARRCWPIQVDFQDLDHAAEHPAHKPKIASFEGPPLLDDHLVLPYAVVQHENHLDPPGTALDRGRMALVSLVAFYSALGIEDYPFYSLVTSGTVCAVLMAWKSPTRPKTYLCESNVKKFNVSSSIEAFQFAAFLLRLRAGQEKLQIRVSERLRESVDRERLSWWKKSKQMDEADLAALELDSNSDS
ncbi:hypothetical protein B0H13DRAFT_1947686 [Mycena leptocephala]|nr:hypothetical protein B0H13DRAFT_1947686 [Mycena leptocephala]